MGQMSHTFVGGDCGMDNRRGRQQIAVDVVAARMHPHNVVASSRSLARSRSLYSRLVPQRRLRRCRTDARISTTTRRGWSNLSDPRVSETTA